MEFSGRLLNVSKDMQSGKYQITFTVNEPAAVGEAYKMKDYEKLSIKAAKYKKKRSLDANALLWHCLGEIAAVLCCDKWDVYLRMLKRYGRYTYICVKPNVVDAVKAQWRESEVIGEMDIHGQPAVQILCYFGSSTYDTREFSVLLDGVMTEMEELGLETPTSQEMQRALELWERMKK